MVTEFDRWVGENNIPTHFEYGKGWWDYVEVVRRFATKFDIEDVRVVGHYVVHTPPPEEKLPMPAVALTRRGSSSNTTLAGLPGGRRNGPSAFDGRRRTGDRSSGSSIPRSICETLGVSPRISCSRRTGTTRPVQL